MRFLIAATGLILASAGLAQQNETCTGTQDPCETPMGSYHIILPERADGPVPALFFFHGAGGSGRGMTKGGGMARPFLDRGYAVISPNGLKRPNSRFGPGWSFHPEREKQRDELAFTREVLADAKDRFDIDPENVLMSGFSIGGSLAWYLACQDPSIAKAYAPIAGAFWRPHPVVEDCAGPVRLFHTHGWKDTTVPLEGRPLGGGRIYQGDVHHGMDLLGILNGCENMRPDAFEMEEERWTRIWSDCSSGHDLRLMMHPGAHGIPRGWSVKALDWFEAPES